MGNGTDYSGGLSPRVRGNLPSSPPSSFRWRSIPACAGEPGPCIAGQSVVTVYPRVCGGTDASSKRRPIRAGSIPACAGEPGAASVLWCPGEVYPRVCGGTRLQLATAIKGRGLSPRVRGNRGVVVIFAVNVGSIPACAGEPQRLARAEGVVPVYPRVCGGTVDRQPNLVAVQGLSPRVRGNRYLVVSAAVVQGSIPACAGEPAAIGQRRGHCRVYPRVCGGTALASTRSKSLPGLSPRVRGNHRVADRVIVFNRSIPACAGEPRPDHRACCASEVYPRVCGGTRPRRPRSRHLGVYPRVCGGTRCSASALLSASGLSPRVRGNLDRALARLANAGSIPACAGEPRLHEEV